MATSSFEKNFVITDKEAPLWEAALDEKNRKKIKLPKVQAECVQSAEINDFMARAKA